MPLYFEDIAVGMRYETSRRTVTEVDLVNFSGVSGDVNPLHTDEEYARTTMFGRRIAHGALVVSIATGLRSRTGMFEGTLMAFLEIRSWRFLKPVFIGDTVHVTVEVRDLRPTSKPDRGIMVQHLQVLNQRDEVVGEGEFVQLLRRKDTR